MNPEQNTCRGDLQPTVSLTKGNKGMVREQMSRNQIGWWAQVRLTTLHADGGTTIGRGDRNGILPVKAGRLSEVALERQWL